MHALLTLGLFALWLCVAIGHLDFRAKHVHGVMHKELKPFLRQTSRADAHANYTVYFAIQLLNMGSLEDLVLRVSNPDSLDYGRHLSREEAGNWVRNQQAASDVLAFLQHEQERYNYTMLIERSLYDEYIWATAPVWMWESVFETTLYSFEHPLDSTQPSRSVRIQVGSTHYSLPAILSASVLAVFPLCNLSPPRIGDLHLSPLLPPDPAAAPPAPHLQAAPRDGNVRPALLYEYYQVPTATLTPQKDGNNGTLSYHSIYATIGQTLSPTDLARFQTIFNLPAQTIKASRGGFVNDFPCYPSGSAAADLGSCVEANLDVQYAMSIAPQLDMLWDYSDASFAAWAATVSSLTPLPQVFSLSYGQDELATSSAEKRAFLQQVHELLITLCPYL